MIRVLKRGFVLFILVMVLSAANNIFAATIGQPLTTKEAGWERFDDTDSRFIFNGRWLNNSITAPYSFSGTVRSTNKEGNLVFKFTGTKIRIISPIGKIVERSKKVSITIDDKEEFFSMYSPSEINQALVYDKTSLSNKEHIVVIKNADVAEKIYYFDAIDIDSNGKLLTYNCKNLTAAHTTTSTAIELKWDKIDDTSSYIIKRSTTQDGHFDEVATVDAGKETYYVDNGLLPGTPYYYIVVPVTYGVEGIPSNKASATTIEEPVTPPTETGNAALMITMTNGNIKQYNVGMTTVNNFISWYNNRAAGSSGTPYFVISKNENLAPYNKKTEYLVFDKISSFEVDEYAQ